ncbi:MAG: ABC transporter ATP-binding protein [Lachnospiraceae bacterium]|nr:ABC transporter ATP-binding protein [Lachnospiraceae bacterium]
MKEKPKYNMWQGICYMVRKAWTTEKSVLWLCIVVAFLQVSINLAQLFVAPEILAKIEQKSSLAELLWTVTGFALLTFLLRGLKGYVDTNTLPGRCDVRSAVLSDLNVKTCATSYPHIKDKKIIEKLGNALNTTNSNSSPAEHIWTTLSNLLANVTGFGIYLALLSNLHPFLMIVVLVTSIFGFVVSKRINEWEYRHKEERSELIYRHWYIMQRAQSVEFAKDIRILGLRPWLTEIYEKTTKLLEAYVARREKTYIWGNVLDVVLSFARNGIAYGYLISITLEGGLSAAQFLLYFTAVSGFTEWVTGILQEIGALDKECQELSHVQEYLNMEEPFRFEGGMEIPQLEQYELTLENVSFRYPETEDYIFKNVNLVVKPGEKLAVVGLNGAGKTTLVKLLCGFYDPDEGRVLLNGIDIREFNRQEYYQKFTAVFQHYQLLDVTVKENVAQTVEDIDEEKVNACLEKAGLLEFVKTLPEGVDSHVGRDVYLDGILFSGGQTQRLVLARALYKDAPILILDEPTAALDAIAENDIYMKYSEMTEGKTSVFISHRLASTRFCDRILLLQDGGIAEEGTHEQLIALGGKYAELFEVQSRYYQEGGEVDE